MAEEIFQRELSKLGFGGPEPSPITNIVSNLQIRRAQRKVEEEAESQGFWDLVKMRQLDAGTVPSVIKLLDRPTPIQDEPISAEIINELTYGITDQDAVKRILDALEKKGPTYARAIASEVRRSITTNEALAQAGLRGAGAMLLSDSMDPADLVIMTQTAAAVAAAAPQFAPITAPAAAAGVKAARMFGRFKDNKKYLAAAMGIGGAELGGLEYLRAQAKYDITGGDVILAASIGAGGSLAFTKLGQVFTKRAMIQRAKLKQASGEVLSEYETTLLRQNDDDVLTERLMQEAHDSGEFDVEDIVEAVEGSGLTRKDISQMTPEEIAEDTAKQRGGLLGFRGIISAFVNAYKSEDDVARLLADRLGQNSSGNIPGPDGKMRPVAYGAIEQRDGLQMIHRHAVANPVRQALEESGIEDEDFFTAVAQFMRGSNRQFPPAVLKAAEIFQKEMDKIFRLAIKSNAAGFTKDMIGRISNYLPRIFDEDYIFKVRKTQLRDNPDGTLNEGWFILGEEAIRRGQPDLEENVAAALKRKGLTSTNEAVQAFIKRMARGYMQGVVNPRFADNAKFKLLDGNIDVETFAKMMEAEVNIDGTPLFRADQLDVMLEVLTRDAKVKGHPRSRPRMILDEMAEVTLEDSDGNLFTLAFNDLLEQNASALFDNYVFQLSGAIALARNGINTNNPGSSFETIFSKMTKATDAERNAIRYMYESVRGDWAYTGATIAGQPMSRKTKRWMARGREFGFIAIMGMAGMSAIMEVSNALFEYSLPTLMKTVPLYGKMIRRGQNGEFDRKLMRELAAGTGVGSDGLISRITPLRTREEGDIAESVAIAGERTQMDLILGKGREFVAKWSGLRGVTDILRRVVVFNYASEWAYKTQKGVIPFSAIKREQLGISDEMAQRIKIQIDEHATYLPDGTLDALNVDRWSKGTAKTKADPEAAEFFFATARREATQLVQEMNAGSVNPLVRSEVGKMFFQFLSFPMSSMEQQAMRLGVRAGNGDHYQVSRIMLASMFIGSMMYMSRSYLNSMGRSDQEDYMKKRMALDNILLGAFSQVGAASLFGYIYQITTGTIEGNTKAMTPPVVSLIGSGIKGTADLLEAYTSGDKDLSETELRSLLRILPFSSLYGARQVLNALADAATVDK